MSNVPTLNQHLPIKEELSRLQVEALIKNCAEHDIELYGLGHQYQGIVHVIGPELGFTQPGMTIVCGDSHTSTHGAFGAIAFGIGTSEVEMLIVSTKAAVSATITQPFNNNLFRTHQRIQANVSIGSGQLNAFSPQDLKVVVVQNNIWATSSVIDRPTIFRGNYYEYSDEANTTFPAGKEWRWLDLRSLRLLSDRMTSIKDNDSNSRVDVYVKPDGDYEDWSMDELLV